MSNPWGNSVHSINRIYSPLDRQKTEIRVAVLQPGTSPDARVQVTLRTTSLIDRPSYDALSWAWGDPKKVQPIYLNGLTWWAPENLVIALQHLQPSSNVRMLWVDALCINQSETTSGLAERGHQVQLMKWIYTFARNVTVWIGKQNPYDEGLVPFLTQVRDNAVVVSEGQLSLPASFKVSRKDAEKVQRLLQEPWWTRLWVLQEVVLARSATLCHGTATMSFEAAVDAVHILRHRGHLWDSDNSFNSRIAIFGYLASYHADNSSNATGTFDAVPRSDPSLSVGRRRELFLSFTDVLISCRSRASSDPRDKIFGLLGMAPDPVLSVLQPRYDEAPNKTFIRTTFRLMQETNSLYLLSQAAPHLSGRIIPRLPSWVPDWTDGPHLPSNNILKDSSLFSRNASTDTPAAYCDHDVSISLLRGQMLMLSGIHVDNIEKIGHGYQGPWKFLDLSGHRRRLENLGVNSDADVLLADVEYYRENSWESVRDCLPLPSVSDALNTITKRILASMRHFDAQWRQLHRKIFPGTSANAEMRNASAERDYAWMKRTELWQKYVEYDVGLGFDEHLFVTADGFIGIGPQNQEPGDQVFVLAGAGYPVVLRPSSIVSGRYSFVGECVVAGIMQGESVTEIYGSWRRRKGELLPELQRGPNDEHGIWEEVVLE